MQTATDISSSAATTASRNEAQAQNIEGPGVFRFEGGSYHAYNGFIPLQQEMQNAMHLNALT